MDKNKPETFRNKATGVVWSANPGTEAHKRMVRGVERGQFERVTTSRPAARSKADTSKTDTGK